MINKQQKIRKELENLKDTFEYNKTLSEQVADSCSVAGGEYFRGKVQAFSFCMEEVENLMEELNKIEKWKMKKSYRFFDEIDWEEKVYTIPELEKMFEDDVDEEQKQEGTTFETWVYDMEKMGILV